MTAPTGEGLAARLDFTLDDIEDLRIAVGEACALVLPSAGAGSDLTCQFHLQPGRLTVVVGVDSESASPPDEDSFAWQVLTTLAGDASVSVGHGRFEITLSLHSQLQDASG
jgi:serine/threonine-protein kinase RsbW